MSTTYRVATTLDPKTIYRPRRNGLLGEITYKKHAVLHGCECPNCWQRAYKRLGKMRCPHCGYTEHLG